MNYTTLLVAIIVAFIGAQQFFLSRERFRLDLFDRRFAIFKATQIFLNKVILVNRNNAKDASEWINQFQRDIQESIFLFDEPLYKYLNDLFMRGNQIAVAHELRNDPDNVDSSLNDTFKQLRESQVKMIDELNQLTAKFSPYLKFSEWNYGFIVRKMFINPK